MAKTYYEALAIMLELLQENGSEQALKMLELAEKSRIISDVSEDKEVEKLCDLAVECIEKLQDGNFEESSDALFMKWLSVASDGYLNRTITLEAAKSFADYVDSLM